MITDGAAINRAAASATWIPGSVYAADDQMDKGCCVPPKKPPFLAVHNTPLLDRITSAFRTRTIKDICADQDVCRMFKQSKQL